MGCGRASARTPCARFCVDGDRRTRCSVGTSPSSMPTIPVEGISFASGETPSVRGFLRRTETMTLAIGLDIVDFDSGVIPRPVGDALDDIVRGESEGFRSAWVPLLDGGPDPLAVCGAAATRTNGIRLVTGVMRISGHHPLELARLAATVAATTSGRLTLGVGVSHATTVRHTYGTSSEGPALSMFEYLTILRSLLRDGFVDFEGRVFTARGSIDRAERLHVPIAVAAGGPRMLEVAGRLADVVVTNMAGLRTLESYTLPAVREAASSVGGAATVAAAVAVSVTDRPDLSRQRIDEVLASYAANPDYRAMLDREGVERPSEIAVVGDEAFVTARLANYEEIGLSELVASVKTIDAADEYRTRTLLGQLAKDGLP